MKEKNTNKALMPQCVHTIFCTTIVVISIVSAYLGWCRSDGALTCREMKYAAEYFFICLTEILIFSLAFDIIYKYDKKGKN